MEPELVLIVDDHDGFRALARRMLEASGFGVADVASGAEAVRAVVELDPDLVLLDVQLPDIDGIEVAESLDKMGTEAAIVLTSTREVVTMDRVWPGTASSPSPSSRPRD